MQSIYTIRGTYTMEIQAGSLAEAEEIAEAAEASSLIYIEPFPGSALGYGSTRNLIRSADFIVNESQHMEA